MAVTFSGLAVLIGTLVFAGSAAADGTVIQGLSGGARTASVNAGSLSALSYSHEDQISTGSLSLSVDDSSGTGLGWNVTIEATDFVYSGDYAGDGIGRANFAIVSAGAPQWSAGQAIDPTNGPMVPGANATGSLDQPRKVIQANAGYGQGAYTQNLSVALTVPGTARAGSYSASVIVTISAGP